MMNTLFPFLFLFLLRGQTPAPPPQVPAPPAPPAQQTTSPLNPTIINESSQLGPGDIISIDIWTGNEVDGKQVTVAADGTIFVPFGLNRIIPVSGLTALGVRDLLAEDLRRNYRNPVVQVIQTSAVSKRVLLISDSASRSGYFPISGETKVLQFVIGNSAYSLGSNLADVLITRETDGKVEQFHQNLFNALMGIDPSQNIVLQPNDQVYVPSLQSVSTKIFMYSEGRSISVLQVPERITLLDAFSRSSITLTGSRIDKVGVVRYNFDKKVTEVHEIQFNRIAKADLSVNFLLDNGDIVFIPRARMPRIGEILAAVNPITSFISNTVLFRSLFRGSGG